MHRLTHLCSPAVGMLAAHCAFARGASHVALIDCEEDRLRFARDRIPKGGRLDTINFKGELRA